MFGEGRGVGNGQLEGPGSMFVSALLAYMCKIQSLLYVEAYSPFIVNLLSHSLCLFFRPF